MLQAEAGSMKNLYFCQPNRNRKIVIAKAPTNQSINIHLFKDQNDTAAF